MARYACVGPLSKHFTATAVSSHQTGTVDLQRKEHSQFDIFALLVTAPYGVCMQIMEIMHPIKVMHTPSIV